MAGFKVKDFTTVIMDGSDKEVVDTITDVIDLITEKQHGESSSSPLDSDHPTMMVVVTKTNKKIYNMIQEVIEDLYPGLCVFNPAM